MKDDRVPLRLDLPPQPVWRSERTQDEDVDGRIAIGSARGKSRGSGADEEKRVFVDSGEKEKRRLTKED